MQGAVGRNSGWPLKVEFSTNYGSANVEFLLISPKKLKFGFVSKLSLLKNWSFLNCGVRQSSSRLPKKVWMRSSGVRIKKLDFSTSRYF